MLSVLHQLPLTTSACLYMDVCVLRCTPGHIPRYMGQTSNNKRCQLCTPVMPVMTPVMPVMTPVMPVMNFRYARYIPVMPVMYSCYDRCVICHNCFHQVLLRISGFMIIILYSFMSCLSTYILFHQSPALVVLYHVLIYARHLACLLYTSPSPRDS